MRCLSHEQEQLEAGINPLFAARPRCAPERATVVSSQYFWHFLNPLTCYIGSRASLEARTLPHPMGKLPPRNPSRPQLTAQFFILYILSSWTVPTLAMSKSSVCRSLLVFLDIVRNLAATALMTLGMVTTLEIGWPTAKSYGLLCCPVHGKDEI